MHPEATSSADARRSTWDRGVIAAHLVDRPDMAVDHLVLPPGAALKTHSHSRTRQFFYVLAGEATFVLGPRTTTATAGQGVEIPPRLRHQVRNETQDDVEILLSSAPRPASFPHSQTKQVHQRERGRVVVGSYLRRTRRPELTTIVAIEEALDTKQWIGRNRGLEWHTEVLKNPAMEHWVLVDRLDRIVAFGILSGIGSPTVEIRRMVVAPEGRGQGLGRLLLRHLLEHARQRPSVSRVWLDVGQDNLRARSLYRSFGFVEKPAPAGVTLEDNGLYMEFNAEAH